MSKIKAVVFNPLILLCLAAGFWIWSLSVFNLDAMQDLGLVSIYPVHIIVAYVILIFSFSRLFLKENVSDINFFLHVLLLILMIHGTPQLLYGTLRYSWAWKHVGIVDYIIRHGSVDPTLRTLGVYHNWPGFFALSALFTELAGLSSASLYAGWGAVFFEILFALGLRSLFYLFTESRKLQWLGVWIFLATNWVAQDYFSPQAMSYFMLFGVLILVLRFFGPKDFKNPVSRILKLQKKVLQPIQEWLSGLKITPVFRSKNTVEPSTWVVGTMVLVSFLMIVSTHQLTPNVLIASLVFLILLGYTRWRSLIVWLVLISLFWLFFPARSYIGEIVSSFEDYGQVASNLNAGLIDFGTVSAGQALVALIGRVLTVFIAVLAALGIYRRLRHGYLDLPVLFLAGVVPALIVIVNSYGGEAIFRTYFFAIPYVSFLAAGLFLPDGDEEAHNKPTTSIWIGVVSGVLITGLLFAYSGKDQQYYFTKPEIEAAEFLYSNAPYNSMLIEGSRNYPSQFLNYEYFSYLAIDRETIETRADIINNPEAVLYRWMTNRDFAASYFFITRSQKIATDTLGAFPLGGLEDIQKRLENSEVFEILYSNQDAIIFVPIEGN